MNNKEKLNMVHSASLVATGIMAIIYNIIALANIEISSLVKLIIVVIGIIAVTILIVSFVLKLKKSNK